MTNSMAYKGLILLEGVHFAISNIFTSSLNQIHSDDIYIIMEVLRSDLRLIMLFLVHEQIQRGKGGPNPPPLEFTSGYRFP